MSGDGDEESVTDCNKALSYVPLYALIIEGTSHNVVTGQMTCYYTGSEGVGIKFKQNGNDTDLPICNASGGMWTLSLDKVVL